LLLRHWKDFRLSIHSAVVTVFLIATFMTGAVAIGMHYLFSQSFARDSALAVYKQTATSTHDFVESLDDKAEEIAYMLSKFPKLIEVEGISTETQAVFAEILARNPLLSFITVGFADGGFYQLINLDSNVKIRQQLNATAKDKWVVITVRTDEQVYLHFDYLDDAFNRRHHLQNPTNYDVRTRSWFAGVVTGQVYKSEPYLFQHLQVPGQVYSIPIETSNDVLAVGIALPSLSDFLKTQPLQADSEVYIHKQNGEIVASNIQQKSRLLPSAPPLQLTDAQKQVIKNHPYLTVSNELSWPPINFAIAGQPRGYSIDILSYIAEMTGFQLRYVNGLNWAEMSQLFVSEELDIVQPVFFNVTREAVGALSDTFLSVPYGVLTRQGVEAVDNAKQLSGKTIAIHQGWSLADRLQFHFPKIKVVLVDSVEEMFQAVQAGDVDAGIDTAAVLNYHMKAFFIDDVILHEPLSFLPHRFATDLHFMVNRSRPGVAEIINLALSALENEHKQALRKKWFGSHRSARKPIAILPYPELIEFTQKEQVKGLNTLSLKGGNYFVYTAQIGMDNVDGEYLTIITPIDSVMATYMEKVKTSIWVTAVMIVSLLPLIWLFALPLAKSIRVLSEDSEKIKQRQYSEVERVDSRIVEINDLANSMMGMSTSIQEHEASQQALIESFIELIAQAIDDKSPYTAGHCARVPELAFMLAEVANESTMGSFADFSFKNEDEWREFRIGAWLHDCGKITTPEHVIDKGTKLESIYNRIHEVRMRFEVLWRDAEVVYWQQDKSGLDADERAALKGSLEHIQQQLQEDFAFIARCNVGSESLHEDDKVRLRSLAEVTWQRHFDDRLGLSPIDEARFTEPSPPLPVVEKLLSDKPEHIIERMHSTDYDPKLGIKMDVPKHLYNLGELYNLTISAGTLTPEDRFKINEHMISTVKMLESLPFPPELSKVSRYATTHHETMRGTGYPRKLSAPDLSMPERIMVVADIFEALTAADRPYKTAKPISQAVAILHKMVVKGNIDADVFELFLTSGVYMLYAKRFLPQEQIDHVKISQYLRDE
jgi:HD-GYP domain-containing protein (c-di-GMP phosphodiesterase class II)/ABC-type amino acid transport substrate-binding protein